MTKKFQNGRKMVICMHILSGPKWMVLKMVPRMWTVLSQSGRYWMKADGLGSKWTVPGEKSGRPEKYQNRRSRSMKVDGPRIRKWTI